MYLQRLRFDIVVSPPWAKAWPVQQQRCFLREDLKIDIVPYKGKQQPGVEQKFQCLDLHSKLLSRYLRGTCFNENKNKNENGFSILNKTSIFCHVCRLSYGTCPLDLTKNFIALWFRI